MYNMTILGNSEGYTIENMHFYITFRKDWRCTHDEQFAFDSILLSACSSNREVSEGVLLSRETAGVNTAVLPAHTDSA